MGASLPVGQEEPSPGSGPPRLSPAMSSRKLLALDFIKRYFARWGQSPTLGELAAALDVSTKRAHDLVHQLAELQMIEHIAGKPRGIRLPDRGEELSEADILLRLAAMGWTVGHGDTIIAPAEGAGIEGAGLRFALVRALTEKGLHELPVLDHDPEADPDDVAPPHSSAPSKGRHGQAMQGTNGQRKEPGPAEEGARAGHADSFATGDRRAPAGKPGSLGAAAP